MKTTAIITTLAALTLTVIGAIHAFKQHSDTAQNVSTQPPL